MISRSAHLLVVALALLATGFVARLIRTRKLKGKYSVLWMLVCAAQLLVAVFPIVAVRVASWVGIESAANAAFLAVSSLLVLVVVDLSWELSRIEDRSRRLAEEIALLRLRLDDGSGGPASAEDAHQGHDRRGDDERRGRGEP